MPLVRCNQATSGASRAAGCCPSLAEAASGANERNLVLREGIHVRVYVTSAGTQAVPMLIFGQTVRCRSARERYTDFRAKQEADAHVMPGLDFGR